VSSTRYSVLIRGELDPATLERIGVQRTRRSGELTELRCDVVDQSQLMGLLASLNRDGVEVVSAAPLIP
jgi:hypothetical protein